MFTQPSELPLLSHDSCSVGSLTLSPLFSFYELLLTSVCINHLTLHPMDRHKLLVFPTVQWDVLVKSTDIQFIIENPSLINILKLTK